MVEEAMESFLAWERRRVRLRQSKMHKSLIIRKINQVLESPYLWPLLAKEEEPKQPKSAMNLK